MESLSPVYRSTYGKAVTVIASADLSLRQRVRSVLEGLRWNVIEASGGAEAFAHLEEHSCEALLLDGWLPDLEIQDFIREFHLRHPETDLVMLDADAPVAGSKRSARRQELLYAMRCGHETKSGVEITTKTFVETAGRRFEPESFGENVDMTRHAAATVRLPDVNHGSETAYAGMAHPASALPTAPTEEKPKPVLAAGVGLPEFIGESAPILELCRLIRLVAPRKTTVLIEGPTGSGKELVARAIQRLSTRSRQPFVVLNCAAIPESLLEAELFGHTRGAFTGAVLGRTGRLEAAHQGTLFLDEIGEMPLALQAKMLRFLEQGELQRVGENEPVRVDVRVIAATHQRLAQKVQEGSFRPDLYFRLAVFPLEVPGLDSRNGDIPMLVAHFLNRMAADSPAKKLSGAALQRLLKHSWPGNVRELQNVLERAYILAEDRAEIEAEEIRFGQGQV
ncbi:MAG TPA: sigma-54 dependent transcriptional regulator [Acidobacteriaceae bacterium]|nr:sigma-54 dependent transcriptional regulator [Acidobacteriaceae bacterium]